MNNKIQNALLGGIIGTAVMTLVMFIGPMMGMPKMNTAKMLSTMMGFPVAVGWIMHFMIGVIFAMAYAFFFIKAVRKINNKVLKGVLFGLAVYVFAQIMIAIMGTIFPMPPLEGSMGLMIIGSLIGHFIYGIVVTMFVKEQA